MRFSFPAFAVATLAAIAALVGWLWWGSQHAAGPGATKEPLFIYCAAGLREPMEAIAADYQAAYGVPIEFSFKGSGALLADIRAAGKGDLFLAADHEYISKAANFQLTAETFPVATQHPVIAVAKGNPKGIFRLADLTREDVRLSLPNPDVAAVGKSAQKLLTKEKLNDVPAWGAIFAHKIVARDTVNAVADDVKLATADAGIIWDATALQYADLDMVDLPEFKEHPSEIELAVLSSAADSQRALHFCRYVTAPERGLKHWRRLGYATIAGDPWSETPELSMFSGGVLRPAVEEAVQRFEEREGVKVSANFNGCGILLGQLRGGATPDLYFACDTSFMTPVSEQYPAPLDVASTPMVIIVPKGNPESIRTLADLARPGLKVGLCHPEQSALGKLSKDLLERQNLLPQVMANVRDTPATADRLTEHVVIGSLQAAIVYKANALRQADQLEIIALDDPQAFATQPIAIAGATRYPRLAERLERYLRAAATRELFERHGFEWRGEATQP